VADSGMLSYFSFVTLEATLHWMINAYWEPLE
jgi:hypothetical protein